MRLTSASPAPSDFAAQATRKWSRLPSASFIRDALRRDLSAFRRVVALTMASGAVLAMGQRTLQAQTVIAGDTQYQFQNSAGVFSTTTDPGTGAITNQGFTPSFPAGGDVNAQLLFGGAAAYTATDDQAAANVNNLTFTNTALTTIAASATTNVLTLTPNTLGVGPSIFAGSGGATIQVSLAGTAGFTKTGTGTLTLNTNADTFTGNVFVNAGTLAINIGQSGTAGFILANGATVTTNQVLTTTNVFTIASGSSTLTDTSTTFAGVLAGSGNVTFALANTTTFPNTFFSAFGGVATYNNNNGFRFQANSDATFATVNFAATTGQIFTRDARTMVFGAIQSTSTGSGIGSNSVSGASTYVFGSANTSTSFAGIFGSGGSFNALNFVKVGTGTFTINPTTAYLATGTVSANGGTLLANYANATAGIFNAASPLSFGGGTLSLLGRTTGATAQTLGATTLAAGGGRLVLNANGGTSLTLNVGALTTTAAGGSLNINAGVNTVLTTTQAVDATGIYGGRITYTDSTGATNFATSTTAASPFAVTGYTAYGAFNAAGGTDTSNSLLTGSAALAAPLTTNSLKATTSAAGQTLDLGTNRLTLTSGGLLFTGANAYAINNGTLASATSAATPDLILHQFGAGTLTIGAVIADGGTGASTLTKAGPGTLILTGTNTYTGATFLNNGTTVISANANLGAEASGATLTLNNATLQATATFGLFNGAAGTNNRAVNIGGGGGTFDITGTNNLTIAGVVGSQVANQFGPLIKTDTGTLTLAGAANTYGGATQISGGVLSVSTLANGGTASSIGSSRNLAAALVLDGGTLQYTGADVSTDRAFTLTQNGGTLDASGTGVLNFTSTLPTVFTGSGARTLTLTGTNTSGTNVLASALSDGTGGATSLVKAGAATWQLTNSGHTYTGATIIQDGGGTLILTAPLSSNPISASQSITVGSTAAGGARLDVSGLSGGTLSLAANQTLGGAGIVAGSVAVNNLSFLSPGSSAAPIGTLGITGALTLNAGSTTNIDLSGSTSDIVSVGGNLTLNATEGINLFQAGTLNKFNGTGTFTLFNSASLTGTPSSAFSVLNPSTGLTYSFATVGTQIRLTIGGTPTVTSTWNIDANGNYGTASNWNNNTVPDGAGTTAIFGSVITAPRTVNIEANHTVGEIDFSNTNAYTLAGSGTLTLNNGTNTAVIQDQAGSHAINASLNMTAGANVTVVNAANTLTVGGVVGGAGLLTKLGPGTLALTGANTYTGGTLISNGTVQINSASSLGAATGNVALNSATSAVTLQTLSPTIVSARPFTVAGANNTFLVDGTNSYELDGVVADGSSPGTLTKTGTGTLILGGNNTYMGISTVSAGTLQLGAGGTSGSVVGNIVNNGTLALNRTDDYALGNLVSGSGGLSKQGTDNVTLNAANTFTGATVIAGGSLILGNALALQNSTLNYNNQGGTLSFGTQTTATLGGLSGTQTLDLDNTTPAAVALSVGSSASSNYGGALTGLGSLNKIGSGTFTLSGANTYTGVTTINGGVLSLTGSLGSAAAPAAAVTLTSGNLTVSGGSLFTASITQPNTNAPSLNLTNNGTINVTGTYAVNSSSNAQGGLTSLLSGSLTANSLTIGRTGLSFTALPAAGSATDGVYVNGATVNIAATLGIGNNTLTNSSANLRMDSGAVTVGGSTFITDNNGGRFSVLDVNGGTFTSNDTTGAGIVIGGTFASTQGALLVRGTGTLNTNTVTFGDAVQTAGMDTFNVNGGKAFIGAGGLVVGGPGAFVPSILLTSGTLGARADWSTSVPITLPASNTGIIQTSDAASVAHTITVGAFNATTGTLNGGFTGAGNLTVGGTGTLVLNTQNNYSGTTTINGGTVNLAYGGNNVGSLISTTAVTLNTGGTLLLTGDNLVTDRVRDAATVTLAGGTLNTGGLSEGSSTTAGLGAVTLSVSSVIDLGAGASVLAFSDSSLATWAGRLSILNWSGNATTGNGTDQVYFLAATDGSHVGLTASQLSSIQFFRDGGSTPIGSGATLLSSGEIIPVPEPTTNVLILAGMAGIFGWTQRRRLSQKAQAAAQTDLVA